MHIEVPLSSIGPICGYMQGLSFVCISVNVSNSGWWEYFLPTSG